MTPRGTFLHATEINTKINISSGRDAKVVVPYNVKYIFDAQRDKNHITHFTAGGRGDPSPTIKNTSSLFTFTYYLAKLSSPTQRMNPFERDVEGAVPYKHIFTLVPLKKIPDYPKISSISFSVYLFILSKSIAEI